MHERRGRAPWTEWPEGLRDRDPVALADARAELGDDVRYRQYLQWLAEDQWQAARAAAGRVILFGDLPFMVALDSADVWARQDDFRLDASLGVPPDAFSETGQDWKLPVYQWDVIAEGGFAWLHQRARRNAALFGGYRVDHLVGLLPDVLAATSATAPVPASSRPPTSRRRRRSASGCSRVFLESGAQIVAEDLGVVPDFVRASLARMQVPGLQGVPLGAALAQEGRPFADPADLSGAVGRDLGHARHRDDGHVVGDRAPPTNARRRWRFRSSPSGSVPTAVRAARGRAGAPARRSATRSSKCCSRRTRRW